MNCHTFAVRKTYDRKVAQLVAYYVRDVGVGSSSLLFPTNFGTMCKPAIHFFVLMACLMGGSICFSQTGNASYYSDKLHGRRMSNGEKYHRDSFTCAHLKYPLGSFLRVRNPLNNKEVIVRVTDRGPFSKRFIIDLSRAAARELDLLHRGFAQVEITPYYPQVVPYRMDSTQTEIPELNIEYTPVAVYPDPAWMKSETVVKRDTCMSKRDTVKRKGILGVKREYDARNDTLGAKRTTVKGG